LIIGTPYVDIGGDAVISCLQSPELKCNLHFTKRGFFSKEEFKCEGYVSMEPFIKSKKNKGGEQLFKIHGNWNSKIYVTNLTDNTTDLVFTKNPYPEKWEYMYGMSHFSL
jgi:hypothetical protein